jgi:hypothetical protein
LPLRFPLRAVLFYKWVLNNSCAHTTPNLYDATPISVLLDAALCPATPILIDVGDDGATKEAKGTPNAGLCFRSYHVAILDRLIS